MRYTTYERFFMCGIKQVINCSPADSKFDLLLKNYPYIDKELFPPLGGDCLFFQDEELKEKIYREYLEPNKHLKKFSPEFNQIMGTILGYPPKAVEYFSNRENRDNTKHIGLYFCGVQCASSLDHLVEDVQWLWETYPYPDRDVLSVRYQNEYMEFPFGDIQYVKDVQERAIKYIEQKNSPARVKWNNYIKKLTKLFRRPRIFDRDE